MDKSDCKYIDPFDSLVKEFSQKLDSAYEKQQIEEIEKLIDVVLASIKSLNPASQASLYYSLGTAFGDLETMSKKYQNENNIEKQIFCFRKSIDILSVTVEHNNGEYRPFILGLKMPLYTNYANCLDKTGRKIAALEYYNKVLNINPDFAMAIGNSGISYLHYSMLVYDLSHRDYLNNFAYKNLKKALSIRNQIYNFAEQQFRKYLESYDKEYVKVVLEHDLDIPQYYYENSEEFNYRKWALKERLFLNPLNDLPVFEMCFAADVIHLPSMVVSLDAKPTLHGLYNQLKQEYVFARYQYYESLQFREYVHFADKDTFLLNFSDYPQYSIRVEKMKSSFRILYSLLDKVAFFINEYFDLGIRERDVSFRSIWRKEKKAKSKKDGYKYRNTLNPDDNFALNSIYWISKDLYEKLYEPPNPNAKELNDIRNSLEHKYVKVYSEIFPIRSDGSVDDLAYYLSEKRLKQITLDIMKLIREVLINLSLAVHSEEIKRDKKRVKGTIIPKVNFMNYEDEWKM